jgi:predicted small lipoprotein YifL
VNSIFSLSRYIFLLIAIASLSACGQRGPLYLQAKPAPLPATAPASTTAPVTP